MKCKYCQAELEEGATLCPACGMEQMEETVPAEDVVAAEEITPAEEVLPEEPVMQAPTEIKEGIKATPGKIALAVGAVVVLGKNKLNIYHKDALYQIKGDAHFNGLKYMNIFYRNQNQRAGDGDFLGI